MKKQQSGFTLIELIIVVVILGILAVTAAPKFIGISSDATTSTLQGVRAALKSGADLVFAKSAIAGKQNTENAGSGESSRSDDVNIGSVRVETQFGYPDGGSMTAEMLLGWVDLPTTDWDFDSSYPAAAAGSFAITPNGRAAVAIAEPASAIAATPTDAAVDAATDTRCQVIYTESTGVGVAPSIIVYSGGC